MEGSSNLILLDGKNKLQDSTINIVKGRFEIDIEMKVLNNGRISSVGKNIMMKKVDNRT